MNRALLLLTIVFSLFAVSTAAQSRDFLTDDEIELVRDAQQMDQRVGILIKAVDRRFAVLGINAGGEVPKKSEVWGDPPKGTRTELLNDIKKILQKAADDVDNLVSRPDSIVVEEPEPGEKKKKVKGFKEIITLAVNKLAPAAARYKPFIAKELESTKDPNETGLLIGIGDLCDDMIAAPAKLSTLK